tara:strand:- start:2544 stop:2795 length:252 start_codon:yes stop_codon:yes gene_type:complete
MTESTRHKICGLYINEDKQGNQYLTGKTLDKTKRFSLFLNKFKETDNHPDWILYEENLETLQPVEPKKLNLSPQKNNTEEMPF